MGNRDRDVVNRMCKKTGPGSKRQKKQEVIGSAMVKFMTARLFLPPLLLFIILVFLFRCISTLSFGTWQMELILQSLAALGCAVVWLLFFLSFRKRFIDRIVNPLARLSKTASSVAAGNIYEIAEIENQDEIWTVAEAFKTISEKLRLEIEIKRLAADVSNDFIEMASDKIPEGVEKVLERVGFFLGADRGYVCYFSKDLKSVQKFFQWRRKGMKPGFPSDFDFFAEFSESILPSIMRNKTVYLTKANISSGDELNDSSFPLPEIQTVLCVPMTYGKVLKGFIGFDSADEDKRWSEEELRLPIIVAKIVCNSLERIRTRTALRRTQEELEQRVRERTAELALAKTDAEAANRARSAFLANMTHELRTPMNAILGFTRLMADDPLIPQDQKEALRIIKRSAEDLLKMITKILETAKTESDKAIIEISSFDFYGLIREVEEIMRIQAEHKGLVFSIKSHPDLPRLIKTDRSKLREILLNLLSNAVKFTRVGEVSLSITPLMNGFRNFPAALDFRVEDSGPGIAPEYLKSIFEPFFQVSDSYESGEGAGLGLSICRKFVSLLGGVLKLESHVGTGTVFYFNIRIEPPDEKPPVIVPEKKRVIGIAPGQKSPGILVAEEDENNRILLVHILRNAGFETFEAKNGEEAVEQCEKRLPRMVLMNTKMPLMDGYEAARVIKKKQNGHITILALTAGVLEEKIDKIRNSGFDGFIAKPFHENDIFDAIETHLGIEYIQISEDPGRGRPNGRAYAAGALNSDSLANLPVQLLANLEEAVSIGSMDMISKIVAKIRAKDPELAFTLDRLADEFKYDRILKALRRAQAASERSQSSNSGD